MSAGPATSARPILILGGTGQIGWEIRRSLAPLGPVAAPPRGVLDLADERKLRAAVGDLKPLLIVNAAADTDVDGAESKDGEARAMRVNGEAPGWLAEEAARLSIPLVHYSTDYVFDGESGRPYAETDLPAPLNAYGRSKLMGEERVARAGGPHLILRTSWVYGRRGRNFLLMIERLARERDELAVVDDQIGAPTWARIAAEATAQILARCWRPDRDDPLSGRGGLYHLAAAGQTSWHGFAVAVLEHMRSGGAELRARTVRAIRSSDLPRPARRPAYSVLDCGKLARAFGIALPDWRTQLALCLER